MKRSPIDTGFLSAFRLFVGFRLIFSLATGLVSIFVSARVLRFEQTSTLAILESALLFAYLSIPWLANRLGKFYLPIALIVATVAPILENYFLIDTRLSEEVSQIRAVAGQWQLSILLLIPIILMGWKYRFRLVALYIVLLFVLDGVLTALVIGTNTPSRLIFPGISVLIFRTLIFLLIAYIVSRLATDQRSQNARLAEANRRLAASANTLEQLTISRERNRLARELHDTLAHSLSAVAVQLEASEALWESDPKQAHAMLDHSLKLTRNGLNEARRAIQALRTAPVEDLGLNLALRNMATSEAERGGFEIAIQLPEEMPRLEPEVEHSLYRIAEEALRNISRHASARHVTISLKQQNQGLEMMIQDDGCGFVDGPDLENNHFGLKGMHERAEMIGAGLHVRSQPEQGTTIQLVMEQKRDPGSDL